MILDDFGDIRNQNQWFSPHKLGGVRGVEPSKHGGILELGHHQHDKKNADVVCESTRKKQGSKYVIKFRYFHRANEASLADHTPYCYDWATNPYFTRFQVWPHLGFCFFLPLIWAFGDSLRYFKFAGSVSVLHREPEHVCWPELGGAMGRSAMDQQNQVVYRVINSQLLTGKSND